MTSQVPAFVLTLQRQMADYNERVAERIVNARERKGLSAERLALEAGVSIKQMGRIEAGKSQPRLSTVRKIAEAMELEVTDLRPDLEAEERELRDQLDRMEEAQEDIIHRLDYLIANVPGLAQDYESRDTSSPRTAPRRAVG